MRSVGLRTRDNIVVHQKSISRQMPGMPRIKAKFCEKKPWVDRDLADHDELIKRNAIGFAIWCRMVRARTFPGLFPRHFASRHLSRKSLLIPFSCWHVQNFSHDVGTSPT